MEKASLPGDGVICSENNEMVAIFGKSKETTVRPCVVEVGHNGSSGEYCQTCRYSSTRTQCSIYWYYTTLFDIGKVVRKTPINNNRCVIPHIIFPLDRL